MLPILLLRAIGKQQEDNKVACTVGQPREGKQTADSVQRSSPLPCSCFHTLRDEIACFDVEEFRLGPFLDACGSSSHVFELSRLPRMVSQGAKRKGTTATFTAARDRALQYMISLINSYLMHSSSL
mmetsp:Transcript_57022/g.94345  ORF Transcript_57022/g.94345 Transcript_57022/m.94345 type:complete len:126 (+) Transcript_57022:443-820(+)